MATPLDPYHDWLAIAADQRPPDHYALLGVPRFEANPEAIDLAADRRVAQLRGLQTGPDAGLAQRMLREITAARVCLRNPSSKAAYDSGLRSWGSHRRPIARPVPLRPESVAARVVTPVVAPAVVSVAAPTVVSVVAPAVAPMVSPTGENEAAATAVDLIGDRSSRFIRRRFRRRRSQWPIFALVGGLLAAAAILEGGALYYGVEKKPNADLSRAESEAKDGLHPSALTTGRESHSPSSPSTPGAAESTTDRGRRLESKNKRKSPPAIDHTTGSEALPLAGDSHPSGEVKAAALAGLIEVIQQGEEPKNTVAAIESVSRLGPDAVSAVPALTESLQSEFPQVRSHAVEALRHIGPAAKEAVAELARLAKQDADGSVRDAALESLSKIDPASQQLHDILTEALAAGKGKARPAVLPQDRKNQKIALKTIAELGPDGGWSAGLLSELLLSSAKDLDNDYSRSVFDLALGAAEKTRSQNHKLLSALRDISNGHRGHGRRKSASGISPEAAAAAGAALRTLEADQHATDK